MEGPDLLGTVMRTEGYKGRMELLIQEADRDPDLPSSLAELEQKHWGLLNTIYWKAQPLSALENEAVETLVKHGLLEDGKLTELGELAQRHRYLGPWDYSKDGKVWKSCAVIATDGNGNDVLLHAFGPAIDWHIEQTGNDPADLGIDCYTEAGIWVWEGTMGAVRCDTIDYGEEWDHEATGDWRAPTAEEWGRIKDGECPWDKENLPKWPKARNIVIGDNPEEIERG